MTSMSTLSNEELAMIKQDIIDLCPFFIGQKLFIPSGESRGHINRIEYSFYDSRYRAFTTTGWYCTCAEFENQQVFNGKREVDNTFIFSDHWPNHGYCE